MSNELPGDIFRRSEKMAERSEMAREAIKELVSDKPQSWSRTRSEIEDFLSKKSVMAITASSLVFGLFMIMFGSSSVRSFGFFVLLVSAIPAGLIWYFVINNEKRDERLFEQDLMFKTQKEFTRLGVVGNMVEADVANQAITAQLAAKEMDLAFTAVTLQGMGQAADWQAKADVNQDIRNKEHELQVERTRSASRIAELEAQAAAERQRAELLNDLAITTAKQNLAIEQNRFTREMWRLQADQSHEAQMARQNEVTQLRKVLVASHKELRHNPALADQLEMMIHEVDLLSEALKRSQSMSPDDIERQELIDRLMTNVVLQRHGVEEPPAANGEFEA